MSELVDAAWRVYLASAMIAAGLVVSAWGVRRGLSHRYRPTGDPDKILNAVLGFRIIVIGLALAGVGVAWAFQLLWVFVLSLVFGGEELLESTVHISILKRPPR